MNQDHTAAPLSAEQLDKLTKYGLSWNLRKGDYIAPRDDGRYVKIDDVRALIAQARAAGQAEKPVAWLATDLDGRGDVAFTKEEAKRRAGEGCTEFFPLFDVAVPTPQATAPQPVGEQADERALFMHAIDSTYPIPNNHHQSVVERAMSNREAFSKGWEQARAALDMRASSAPAGLMAEILALAETGMCHGLLADDYCSQIVAKIKAATLSSASSAPASAGVKSLLDQFARALSNECIYGEGDNMSMKRWRDLGAKTAEARAALEKHLSRLESANAATPSSAAPAAQAVEARDVYENGPEGMPRVPRMPYAVLDCIIDHSLFRYLASCLEGEDRDRLHGLMHDTANEVLARVSSWPAPAAAAAPDEPVAWMNPETLDVIHENRKRAWESNFGMGGKEKAKGYTIPLVAQIEAALSSTQHSAKAGGNK